MPHCVVEYSSDLEQGSNIAQLTLSLHEAMARSELFDIESIKVRAIPVSYYLVGGRETSFIHATVRLLAGRTIQQKSALSQNVLEAISKMFPSVASITVDVIDINPDTYRKQAEP